MKFEKECPTCHKLLSYTRNYTLQQSIKNNVQCHSCAGKRLILLSIEAQKEKEIKRKEQKKIRDKKSYQRHKERRLEEQKKYRQRPEVKIRNKEYFKQEHVKEKKHIYMKKYTQRVEVKKRIKKYRLNNEEKLREMDRKYTNEKRKDPLVRLMHNFSTSMRQTLKLKKLSKKRRHWEDIVGYSVQELRNHLEKLFQTQMTWENYGRWHIDHIIPISFFNFSSVNDTEFKYCWSLNNLQPLWAKDNLLKGATIIDPF